MQSDSIRSLYISPFFVKNSPVIKILQSFNVTSGEVNNKARPHVSVRCGGRSLCGVLETNVWALSSVPAKTWAKCVSLLNVMTCDRPLFYSVRLWCSRRDSADLYFLTSSEDWHSVQCTIMYAYIKKDKKRPYSQLFFKLCIYTRLV